MTLNDLGEIITALITPFDSSGKVDLNGLKEVIRYDLKLGMRGFYVCGTTGEGYSLAPAERKAIVEAACAELHGRGGAIVNISHMEINVAVDLAKHAAQAGAIAVSTLPPLFYPVTSREVELYYRYLLDRVELPLTLYNIPMLTKLALDEPLVTRLADHPNLAGIKHSSEDTFLLNRFKQVNQGRLKVWSGRDAYYLGGLAMGRNGAIGNSFNLMGDLFVKITKAYKSHETERALQLQQKANEVHRRLQVHGGTQSVKKCLQLLGVNAGHCRLPYQPLPPEADQLIRETVEILERTRTELST